VTWRRLDKLDEFKQLARDGSTQNRDFAAEMNVSKSVVSKLAKKAAAEGWLKIESGSYQYLGNSQQAVR
jgi:Mn-dependent DtxR family transcriptional regulator